MKEILFAWLNKPELQLTFLEKLACTIEFFIVVGLIILVIALVSVTKEKIKKKQRK